MLIKQSSRFGEIDTSDYVRFLELRKLKINGTDVKMVDKNQT